MAPTLCRRQRSSPVRDFFLIFPADDIKTAEPRRRGSTLARGSPNAAAVVRTAAPALGRHGHVSAGGKHRGEKVTLFMFGLTGPCSSGSVHLDQSCPSGRPPDAAGAATPPSASQSQTRFRNLPLYFIRSLYLCCSHEVTVNRSF